MKKLTSNLGRGSTEKAVGGLGEAMAFGLSHELGEDTQSWKGKASLGRGQHSKIPGISNRMYTRKGLSGEQDS